MAAPTAIPHSESSLHHHGAHNQQQAQQPSPNRNSPPPFSPFYTRTAFSLPGGPISPTSSLRNTASGWSTAGAGVNGLKSPPAVTSQQRIQRDYFPDRDAGETPAMFGRHHRAFSTSSTSDSSSGVESNGPPTPASSYPSGPGTTGAPLGRVPSLPMGSSYESIKSKRDSWAGNYNLGAGWAGLAFRPGKSPSTGPFESSGGAEPSTALPPSATGPATGMGGLFRKLSMSSQRPTTIPKPQGSHGHRSMSTSSTSGAPAPDFLGPDASVGATAASPPNNAVAADGKTRGRQGSLGTSNAKRKPSPHGERLLMGWTHAH
ncbi:unnamed protein product [Parajaminaea phylloscopi]